MNILINIHYKDINIHISMLSSAGTNTEERLSKCLLNESEIHIDQVQMRKTCVFLEKEWHPFEIENHFHE